ncbi:UV DNA damage repair endonuclease UvsE [Paenibacillus popilliae]|uniref:Endonuclease n=1 Tax=Paenibacillus popilliae ATCC 14706 TaxID=1212764 RepID=M9M0C6_PAEPP|nr:UV DNA damage repair endonuclease UvsE [Paenibacillus popilliae]GAC42174.1 endonuclease [Paenibacillus popilliae ATCC 14706]
MLVRFGYVAMSMMVSNASTSRTMTYKRFRELPDREAALHKLERIAAENLHSTLRLLKHNRAHDIRLYRLSSKLIPLATHEALADWDPFPALEDDFAAIGEYARRHDMRLSFHPDHFTVLSTARKEVLESSKRNLNYHLRMLRAMGLDARAKNNIHIGGAYGNKRAAGERFVRHARELPEVLLQRLTLENDDKTFTAAETLAVCERLGLPMALDIHHHQVNNEGEPLEALWPRIARTWETPYAQADAPPDDPLPPKIHVSSPKSEKDPRGHADDVDVVPLLHFLRIAAAHTERLDVMIEAKHKDKALFKLMDDLAACGEEGVAIADQANVRIAPSWTST